MRFLWIDAGNDPDWEKVKAYGMTGLFFPLSDPPADVKRRLDDSRAKGYIGGVHMAANWPMFDGLSGKEVAEFMHARVSLVSPTQPVKVQFDIEHVFFENDALCSAYILETLTRWRALRPKQDTSWTVECFQGGWMSPAFVNAIIALRVRVVPQYYVDLPSMNPVAQDVALKDLLRRGFPYELVTGFYDAAALPLYNAEGWFFTMGRLPA